jgi:cytochrome P450
MDQSTEKTLDQPKDTENGPASAPHLYTGYDMYGTDLRDNYDEVLDDLVRRCPVAESNDGEGYYVLNRYDDVRAAALNWQVFSSGSGFLPNRPEGLPLWAPDECDPPFHDELRKVLNPFFSAKTVAKHSEEISAIANDLIDDFIGSGEVELVNEYANLYAGRVFCEVLAGMPPEDMPRLQKYFHTGHLGEEHERGPAKLKAMEYISNFIEKREAEEPRGDVVDALLGFEYPGYEHGDKVGTLAQLTEAGTSTTGFVLVGAVYHLAQNPDDLARLTANSKAVPTAIEEFLRFYASAPQVGRKTTEDVTIGGAQISKDRFVVLSFGAASRDHAVCPEPTKIDIERSPNRHVSFGAGPHRCIGSHLARLDLRLGLETFLERIPDFELSEDFVPEYEIGPTRTMAALPIKFSPQQQ